VCELNFLHWNMIEQHTCPFNTNVLFWYGIKYGTEPSLEVASTTLVIFFFRNLELWTLNHDADLRTWPIWDQDEPACQTSRSTVILFKSYCPNTQTDTQRTDSSTARPLRWSATKDACSFSGLLFSCAKYTHKYYEIQYGTRNVGQCPTWWPPCRI